MPNMFTKTLCCVPCCVARRSRSSACSQGCARDRSLGWWSIWKSAPNPNEVNSEGENHAGGSAYFSHPTEVIQARHVSVQLASHQQGWCCYFDGPASWNLKFQSIYKKGFLQWQQQWNIYVFLKIICIFNPHHYQVLEFQILENNSCQSNSAPGNNLNLLLFTGELANPWNMEQ